MTNWYYLRKKCITRINAVGKSLLCSSWLEFLASHVCYAAAFKDTHKVFANNLIALIRPSDKVNLINSENPPYLSMMHAALRFVTLLLIFFFFKAPSNYQS